MKAAECGRPELAIKVSGHILIFWEEEEFDLKKYLFSTGWVHLIISVYRI